ncbi:MAG: hypothetical protein HYV36_04025 [Lentisphaerae bacterium]|nr:hypothetical protein [Lentisphaerota bacterium]
MRIRRIHILLALLVAAVCAIPFRARLQRPVVAALQILKGRYTVASRVAQYGDVVRTRLMPAFDLLGVTYPPKRMALVGIKAERTVEVINYSGSHSFEFFVSSLALLHRRRAVDQSKRINIR